MRLIAIPVDFAAILRYTIRETRLKETEMKNKQEGKKEMANKTKYVYFFGAGQTEGNANMRELLGGKGANLAEMSRCRRASRSPPRRARATMTMAG